MDLKGLEPGERKQIVCPFCGSEMTSGKVRTTHRLRWLPASKKQRLLATVGDEALLGENSFWRGCSLDAHVCTSCKKLVADLQAYL